MWIATPGQLGGDTAGDQSDLALQIHQVGVLVAVGDKPEGGSNALGGGVSGVGYAVGGVCLASLEGQGGGMDVRVVDLVLLDGSGDAQLLAAFLQILGGQPLPFGAGDPGVGPLLLLGALAPDVGQVMEVLPGTILIDRHEKTPFHCKIKALKTMFNSISR